MQEFSVFHCIVRGIIEWVVIGIGIDGDVVTVAVAVANSITRDSITSTHTIIIECQVWKCVKIL